MLAQNHAVEVEATSARRASTCRGAPALGHDERSVGLYAHSRATAMAGKRSLVELLVNLALLLNTDG